MTEPCIVILGGRGMLGSDVNLACQKYQLKTIVLDLPDFDITKEENFSRIPKNATAIINCAAYTNVEKAESEKDLVYKVNAEAVGKLGNFAKNAGVWLLHISTDFVFDGNSDRPYVETDSPNPINAYGASKLAGEQLMAESSCRHCIIRTEWTYGLHGTNFITKMLAKTKEHRQLNVVDDQIGAPTATTHLAKLICDFVEKKPQGLFHFANAGYTSRFEMAKFIFEKLNISVNLASCKTSDYPTAAKRPLNSRFDCSKIEVLLDEPIENWQHPLESFLKEL